MVYETDFYTTRRPYSRPTVSSYSVTTPLRIIPGVGRVYSPNVYTYSTYLSTPYRHYTPISTYSYHLPTYSYDYSLPRSLYLPSAVPIRYYSRSSPVRVVTSPLTDYYSPLIYSVNVRPSVIHREMMRIEHKTRPRYGYDPTEDFLNSASAKEFEDDLRSIRTQTSRVLSRIHAPLPRARRAISCTPFSSYSDRELLDRVRGRSVVRDDIFTLANYAEPARHYTGKSHLACVRICGNKGYPVRKPAYTDDIYDPAKVHNEVQYLSYYLKNRRAAAEKGNNAPKLESELLTVRAPLKSLASWASIAKKYRFDNEEYYNLVRVLDVKERTKLMCYATETHHVDDDTGKTVDELKARKVYSVQPEAMDQYLEEVKQRKRPLRRYRRIISDEEDAKAEEMKRRSEMRLEPHMADQSYL